MKTFTPSSHTLRVALGRTRGPAILGAALLALSGCSATQGQDGQNGYTTLINVVTDGATACAGTGDLVQAGVDDNHNGQLDADEVDTAFEVCDGTSGQDGTDGQNGTDGVDGQDGADGQDGTNALLNTVEDGATSCPNGGDLVEVGVDDNRNGALEPAEVDASFEVCDGADGSSAAPLMRVADEPAGTNCPDGGSRVELGTDANANGALDDAEVDAARTTFICQPAETPTYRQIETGYTHACALTESGHVWCWGDNRYLQLGHPGANTPEPRQVPGLSHVTSIAAGLDFTCALLESGGVKCWGSNSMNQLGRHGPGPFVAPHGVVGLGTNVVQLTAGRQHACALMSTGGVKCWGRNTFRQLGRASPTQSGLPGDVTGLTSGVAQVVAGNHYTCALTDVGGVKCWGVNRLGQLGATQNEGTTDGVVTPVDAGGFTAGVVSLAAGGNHVCVVTDEGAVQCWGNNNFGQLGSALHLGVEQQWTITPQDVTGMSSGVFQVFGHGNTNSTCALLQDGQAKCWGNNYDGQLGNPTNAGTSTPNPTPLDVTGLMHNVVDFALGEQSMCMMTADRDIKCVGSNHYGQLGRPGSGAAPVSPALPGL